MKMKYFTLNVIALLLVCNIQIFSQSVLEVPPKTDGQPTALNEIIWADTLTDGSRIEDRVYKLERGEIYLWNALLEIDGNLRLTADDDESVRPPMIAASPHPETGEITEAWLNLTGDNIEVHWNNILFQAVAPNGDYPGTWLVFYNGDGLDVIYDNCIFNGFRGGVHNVGETGGVTNSVEVTNCVFRNCRAKWHPFMGQGVMNSAAVYQKIHVINNTFFNHSSYIFFTRNAVEDYRIEHNTIFGNVIQPVWNFMALNTSFKDNLFFAPHSFGVTGEAAEGGWFGDDNPAIISLLEGVAELGDYTEAGRVVDVSNNVYFVPKKIDDYWQEHIDAKDSVVVAKPLWINETTQAMFDNDTDYPNLSLANNITDQDPGFNDEETEEEIVDRLIEFNDYFAEWGWEGEANSVDFHYPQDGEKFNIEWPLPEDLSYSNEALLIASSTGGPVGDSRWFPEATSIQSKAFEEDMVLNVYPNPMSSETEISFVVSNPGWISIEVYDIQGKNVVSLVDQEYCAGNYTVRFSGEGLSSGIYFCKMQSGESVKTQKILLTK
jgi:hypothetical protein